MATYSPIEGRAAELTGRQAEADGLDRLLRAVRAGDSQVLVLRGEPGVGKTALLDHVAEQAEEFTVLRAAGVQSEMELAFAGLHQLLAPMLGRLERLPEPQRDALRTAFGTGSGPPPERFLVALAVLTLLSDVAEDGPLLCIVDDEQWVDRASALALAFVARRLHAESVALVFAARARSDELSGLPELMLDGLSDEDSRALLDSVLLAPIDARVQDQLISETHGNPLALLEFARGGTPAERAGGFSIPGGAPLATSIEESFQRRVRALPEPARHLLVLAAADPTGEPVLLWRAADRLGIPAEAATAAAQADLLAIGARVRFRHPLVRSAAYRCAPLGERQRAHGALAEATDPEADPDRRAWHLAHAAPGPDDAVAAELERSAARAQSRGGLAAAAAFLERAAELTDDPNHRAERLIAAATAKRDAGGFDEALRLLAAADTPPGESLLAARVEQLRGRIALEQQRGGDATRLLMSAAKRLEAHDVIAARETHLGALVAAMWAGEAGHLRAAASAARAAPRCPKTPHTVDLLLDAFAIRLTEGYQAAAPTFRQALELLLAPEPDDADRGSLPYRFAPRASALVAQELWDEGAWHLLAQRLVQRSRREGALANLRFALHLTAVAHIVAGELPAAALAVEEDRLIAQAAGNPPIPYTDAILAAWRGHEAEAQELIESSSRYARTRGLGKFIDTAAFACAVLYNGMGRHDAALVAARPAFDSDHIGLGPFVVPELVEAAARTGEFTIANRAHAWLSERTRATPTSWALGIEARARALIADGDAAEEHYRESITRLGETRVRVELARSRLLYGEWLRRERRRIDAREQLRLAHESFAAMGIEAFAERARRELLATGETVRKRTVETRDDLTAQEAQIARLARGGLSNPEIAARLFISPRTVQYHLRKVFTKLGISSRVQLELVLPVDTDGAGPKSGPSASH
jgi:DNA-binding CsgD family transcriptional regulator